MYRKVSEKHLKVCFFDYMHMEANGPWRMTNIVPSGMVGRVYQGCNKILLDINHLNCRPLVSYFHSTFVE